MPSLSQRYLILALIAATIFLPSYARAQAADKLYGHQIYLAADASKNAKESAQALAHWLGKMAGGEFSLVNTPGKQGIFLVLDTSPVLPKVDLKALKAEESNEAFLLYSNDADRLWIVGRSDLALDHGVYWYLDKLGCRWLHPNEKWTIIPHRNDITLPINTLQAPAFALRDFAGTGGFGRPAIDPQQRTGDAWLLYQHQNLLGGPLTLGGHAGEAFNVTYKKELLAHPEYLAEINGKRQPWDDITKPCYSNSGLQALYVKYRLDTLRDNLVSYPTTLTISVEPSDGGGHCECAECKKLGTVSDRVYTLVNLVAKAVAKEFPGKYVNLYAYNEHAMTPNIPIEKNVIVSLVPYGFQRTGLTPEEFIQLWGKKHGFLAMYDYWGIPDWSHNVPDMSPRTIAEKIRFWQQNHVRAFNAESTYSGSMGLNWYLASRLLWNPAQDEKAIVNDYFNKAFGPAQAPIRAMYLSWGDDVMLTDSEVGLCYQSLQKALALTDDPAIRARIIDLGRYVHYLRLWYEYLAAAPQSPERVERARVVINYLWRVYDSNMLHVFRLAQLINRDEHPKLEDINPDNPMWKDIPQLTDAEILRLMADGATQYHPLDIETKRFSSTLTPLQRTAAVPNQQYVETSTFGYTTDFAFAVTAKETTSVKIKILIRDYPGRSDRIIVTDPAGKIVFEKQLPANNTQQELEIPTTTIGNYKLAVIDQKNMFTLQVPSNLPLVCTGPYTSADLNPRTYFYVPAGTKKVSVYCPGVIPIKIYDPTGKLITVERNEKMKQVFNIDVPAGMDDKCWSFSYFKAWETIRLLNVPNLFAFSPEGMMVPVEVKTKTQIK